MNIFRSETAPYIFALLVSAIGWFATTIAEETSRRAVALYTIEPGSDRVRIRIENISRSATLRNAPFRYACEDLRPTCFQVGSDGLPRREITSLGPIYTGDIDPNGDARALTLVATLVPLSSLDVTLFPAAAPADARVTFRYDPTIAADPTGPQDILFLPAGTVTGWFLKHYFALLLYALAAAASLFGVLVLAQLLGFLFSLRPREPKDAPPSRHDVTLHLDRPDRRRDPHPDRPLPPGGEPGPGG